MNSSNQNNINMKNYMEGIVNHYIDDLIKKSDVCSCDLCKMDITAYALNNLPPQYVVTEKGQVYSKISELRQQFQVDVTMVILKAIKVISSNPRHKKGVIND